MDRSAQATERKPVIEKCVTRPEADWPSIRPLIQAAIPAANCWTEELRLMNAPRWRASTQAVIIAMAGTKRPDMQINYGTGKDVSDETIADATSPLVIEWLGSSFIDLPMSR